MDFVVNATAISPGGGLTILEQFISYAADTDAHYYVFIAEDIEVSASNNISIIKRPRMGWLARILWDAKGLPGYLKKHNIKPQRVISLQNTTANVDYKQIVYLHQPLPFYDLLTVLRTKKIKLIFYYLFYSFFVFLYDKKDTQFVVQTTWLKEAVIKKKPKLKNRVYVFRPDNPRFDTTSAGNNVYTKSKVSLFYPAAPYSYKNHILLLKALNKVNKDAGGCQLRVTFCKGDFKEFDLLVDKLGLIDNVHYLGFLDKEALLNEYNSCQAMLFPSFIETFGLPLVEAANLGIKILAADLPYARETLNGYCGASFINYSDVESWRSSIAKIISGKSEKFPPLRDEALARSDWNVFFEKLVSGEI